MKEDNLEEFARAGLEFAKKGAFKNAFNSFHEAIKKWPEESILAFSPLANQFLTQSRLEEAGIIFEHLKNKNPDIATGYVGLAQIAHKRKKWQTSLELWENCFQQFPHQKEAFWYIRYASTLFVLGSTKKALEIYETCGKKFPNNVHAFVGIAKTTQQLKQYHKALAYWQICFDRFPADVQANWYRQKQDAYLELGLGVEAQRTALLSQRRHGAAYSNFFQKKLNHPVSNSLNFKHILIITYGRSGSTLLQGVLNTIDGVIMRGENGNIFFDFFKQYQKLIRLRDQYKNALLPAQPWYGMGLLDEEKLITNLRQLAKDILLADQYKKADELCIGFKEIRYNEVGEDFEAYLDFLARLFPNVAFVFNTRNLQSVAKSAWWKEEKRDTVIDELSTLEGRFEAYAQSHDNCFQINYKEVSTKGEKLKELFDFLGAPYAPNTLDIVLAVSHSYKPEQDHVKQLLIQN